MLRDRGHQVTIVSTGEQVPNKVVLKDFSVPFFNNLLKDLKFSFALPNEKLMKETFQECDVVHVQFPFWCSMRAITIAKKLGKSVVATFHIQAENLFYNVGLRNEFWQSQGYRFFLMSIYNRSDWIIFPSEFAKSELQQHGLKVPGSVISNGVPKEYHKMNVEKNTEKFVILMVGRLSKEKRQDLLIEAVAQSKYRSKIHLMLIGDGPLRIQLRELADKKEISVAFDYLDTTEVIRCYNQADLYVHASEIEVECMTAMEAMACGLPVLASNSPKSATKQFALNDKFLFKNTDPSDLAAKIDYWIEHPEELDAAKEQALHSAENYRIERSVDQLEKVYYNLLKDKVITG